MFSGLLYQKEALSAMVGMKKSSFRLAYNAAFRLIMTFFSACRGLQQVAIWLQCYITRRVRLSICVVRTNAVTYIMI